MLEGFDINTAVKTILLLFIAIDPLGNAPIFYAVTLGIENKQRKKIISRSVQVALAILISFAIGGDIFLSYFGLSVNDFRIAGGLILLIYGIAGIMGYTEAGAITVQRKDIESIAIVPLATPLLAGPAAIATILYIKAVHGIGYALLSLALNAVITYLLLHSSEKLMELLGRNGAVALAKIMSILLAAIAVAMIRESIVEILSKTFASDSCNNTID